MNAEYITFHNTANDASANNEIKYMINNSSSTSYHFAVDDKEVVQGLPLNRNAWHCGDGASGTGNRKSIGVEICYSKSGGERYRKAEELGIKFIAQLLHERGWKVDRVKQHFHWNKKHCPHRVRDEGRWNQVLQRIQSELDRLNQHPISSTNRKQTKVYYEGKSIAGFIQDSTTYVQLRDLADLTGIQISYNEKTKQVTFNNKIVQPLIVDGRSYLPLRSVAEDIGFKVNYDSKSGNTSLAK